MPLSLVSKQRFLGPRSLFGCLLAIELVHIVALDMYTPALPSMLQEFGTSAAHLNSTVFVFLLVSAITMLLAGTVSDRLGRKPPLVFGAVLFTSTSLGCALAPSIGVLTAFRCGEAIGYGISASVVPAILKDAYGRESAQVALSLMQSLVIAGPVLSPFLGSAMLVFIDWRGIFAFLAASGVFAIVLACLVTETLPADERSSEPLAASMRDMVEGARSLLAKPGFTSLTLYLSIGGIPFFAFIASSSYIVLDEFGLGYLEYSLVYAVACVINLLAPYVYLALAKRMNMTAIARLATALICLSAVLIMTVAPAGAALLLVAFAPYALAEGVIRPAAYVELLEQPSILVGTASAVSNFAYHVVTALATVAATLSWQTLLFGLGVLTAVTAALTLWMTVAFGAKWNLRAQPARACPSERGNG